MANLLFPRGLTLFSLALCAVTVPVGHITEPIMTTDTLRYRSPESVTLAPSNDPAIRPFRVEIPDAALAELRNRILATRFPERETVSDESQGVPLATMQELAHY